jgi:hypothetical protein
MPEYYNHFRQANIDLSRSMKAKGASLLRGASLAIGPKDEKCRQLLSLKRTLKVRISNRLA